MSAPAPVTMAVRGGTVATERWHGAADVWVSGDRIAAVVAPGTSLPVGSNATQLDATGQLVLPGGVDPHCHVGFTSGEFTTRDGYPDATLAAIHGGTTTIVDFAIPRPGQVPADVAYAQRSLATQGYCDSALHACVVEYDDSVPHQLEELFADGVVTVKMFTTYRGETMANVDTLTKVIKQLGRLGGMPYLHCEANHLIEDAQGDLASDHAIGPDHHHDTRPALAETASVRELLAIAEAVRAPIYFVHQSTAEVVDLIADARRRGVPAFGEAVTHHLVLDDGVYAGTTPELFVCCPPMRPRTVVEQLQQRVFSGEISTVASDHCCYDTAQKRKYPGDVRVMPNGLPGVETRMPVFFSEFVSKRGLSLERFVQLTAANPARLNGIYPQKGTIAPGSDADLVLWDPRAHRTISSADLHMATDYTPYEGLEVMGWPVTTLVKGRVSVHDGQFVGEPRRGVGLRAAAPTLLRH